jgi:hypothetical protein
MRNPDLQKILSFIDELDNYKKSESYKHFLFLRENRTLIAILTDNYRELNKILEYHNSEEIRQKFWDTDPSFRFKLQKQIIRHLSNYLSSLFAVVDYSRKTLSNYLKENSFIFEKYNSKKEIYLKDNFHHKFVQDLRNYTSHNTFIKIGSEFSYNIEWTEPKKSIYVQKSEILEWDGWTAPSKSFINVQEEKIRLNKILKEHYLAFLQFQNWTYLQILLVNEIRSRKFITDTETIYNKAMAVKMSDLLIFKKSYIRYIKFVFQKALHTITSVSLRP